MSENSSLAMPTARATHEPNPQAVTAVPVGVPIAWEPIHSAPRDGKSVILCLGDTTPDIPYVRTGSFVLGSEAEELGYREYAKYGGWLIFDPNCECFHMIDYDEPRGWLALPTVVRAPTIVSQHPPK